MGRVIFIKCPNCKRYAIFEQAVFNVGNEMGFMCIKCGFLSPSREKTALQWAINKNLYHSYREV